MSRPTYQDKQDLENEEEVIEVVSNAWSTIPKKLPRKYEMDFALCRDRGGNWNERFKIEAFTEVKCRTISSTSFDTKIIGIEKWLKACDLFGKSGIPCYLIFEFTDGIFYFQFDPDYKPYIDITMGGRKDRNDWQDHEPVVHIPNYLIQPI